MKRLVVILGCVVVLSVMSTSAFCADPTPMDVYRWESWQQIWVPENAPDTQVQGDVWKTGGEWHTGRFARNGRWIRAHKTQIEGVSAQRCKSTSVAPAITQDGPRCSNCCSTGTTFLRGGN